jgi:outer membrane translocation and assembly module TamA
LKHLRINSWFLACVTMIIISSCNLHRYVPAGDYLYTGAKIKYDKKNKPDYATKTSLENACWPAPNKKLFGIRFGLRSYNLTKPPKGKGLRYFFHETLGEPPVLFSKVSPSDAKRRLLAMAFDEGYLRATISDTIIFRKKNASVKYFVQLGARAYIDTVVFKKDSTVFNDAITVTSSQTLMKKGMPFTLELAREERQRIDRDMRNRGYFYFIADFILVTADTSHPGHIVAGIKAKPNIPDSAKKIYSINNLFILSNYNSAKDTTELTANAVQYTGFKQVDSIQRFRHALFDDILTMRESETYSYEYHQRTIQRLVNLNSFKFINATFRIADTVAKPALDVNVFLTPYGLRSFQIELGAYSKSNDYVGSELKLKLINRNLFHTGDHIAYNITGGYEFQIGGDKAAQKYTNNTIAAGIDFYTPRLWPFKSGNHKTDFIPQKKLSVSLEYYNKSELYTLRTAGLSAGFIWKTKDNWQHNFDPIVLDYLYPTDITPKFDSTLNDDPNLKKSFQKQFILGMEYSLIFNNQKTKDRLFHIYNSFNFYTSGNLLNLTGANSTNDQGQELVLGTPYSQYVIANDDIRGYLKFSKKITWVNRINFGYGYAYGNSEVIPYIKQFFIGGSNSIRAFSGGTIGPGSYSDSTIRAEGTQTGEIKAEFNSEFRYKMLSYFELATFIDAGNIWYRNEEPAQPGSGFSKTWYKDLAVGSGLGFRFDASVMIIRFDFGIPLRIPYYPDGQQWVVNNVKLGNHQWRKDNLVLNIAFGYPF